MVLPATKLFFPSSGFFSPLLKKEKNENEAKADSHYLQASPYATSRNHREIERNREIEQATG